ncbi:MAG: FAD-dependent oxidoreductase [Burkholderiaceae bacterium]
MPLDYQKLSFAYTRSCDHGREHPAHHPVVIVGAGPVGLTCAIDLARQGVPVVVLDDDDTLSTGSRAICFAKRTLEIWDRLGCGERMVDKGVSWNVGKVFFHDDLVYRFDLLEESDQHRPAFINLQQYYVEGFLHEAASKEPNIDLRWKSKAVGLEQTADRMTLTVETPDGAYALTCDYVVACDGARSTMRGMLGLKSAGHSFRDRFLIADVKIKGDVSSRFAAERWFWFDPPFHRGQSVLLHMQPDAVWRVDFQLGWDADPVAEREPSRVAARIKALLAASSASSSSMDVEFEFEWISVYTFACVRMDRFRHGRVLFAGDAAHGVSPFGARGANSGVQDADNLAWKLRLVLAGRAPDRLLDSYDEERVAAADENIMNSTRSTDFLTPKTDVSRSFRDAVLKLARDHPFARSLVNSGRLSVPATLATSSLNTRDAEDFGGAMVPGAACMDAPLTVNGKPAWLLDQLREEFTLICFAGSEDLSRKCDAIRLTIVPLRVVVITSDVRLESPAIDHAIVAHDIDGLVARRFDAKPGTVYLIRPDQHVCGRWRRVDAGRIHAALARATCND